MDFDRLPNEIVLHILQHLPFKERIRIARVSRQFKMISEMAVSLTEGLNLTAAIFREAKWKSMKKLFLCCAANQKKVIVDFPHSSHGHCRSEMLERLRLFTNISHPRLEDIELDTRNGTEHDYNMVRDLLVNHTNIRSLRWYRPNGPFPNVLCEKLESVKIYDMCMYEHAYFASITDYCPNVKSLVLNLNRYDFNVETSGEILQQWQEILNNTFANTPAMQSLELWTWDVDLLEIENVWNLASLRTLIMGDRVSVPVLQKISAAFPQLENFEFRSERSMPIEGASAMQRLKNLRWVSMGMRDLSTKDAYALQLATCHRLQFVLFYGSLPSPIVAAFVNGCPQLRILQMWRMNDIKSPESAISFVKSLDGFVQENLKIETDMCGEVWLNADVQAAVAEVNKLKGHQISIMTTFSSFHSCRQPYRAPTPECTTDRDILHPPYRPSLWERLIMWIRDLRMKIVNMFW